MPGTAGGTDTTQTSVGINGATSATNDNVATNNTTSATVNLIDAVNDSTTTPFATATSLNVLSNDQTNGTTAATTTNVTLTQTVAPTPGSTFNAATGDFSVPNTAAPGVYTVTYQICTNPAVTPAACDTATATITVGAALIDAINDPAVSISSATGGTVPNVVSNDTVFGSATPNAVIGTNVTLLPTLTGAPAGVAINTSTGAITVPTSTVPGVYTVGYTICIVPAVIPAVCDSATVTITVTAAINPVLEIGSAVAGVASTPITNVRSNDTVNGAPATSINSTIALDSTGPVLPVGMTLNTTTGAINTTAATPPGIYGVKYQLCDLNTPANCASVMDTVTVAAAINPVLETGSAVAGTASTPITNVRTNDTVNGAPATSINSTIALDPTGPALPVGMSLNTTTGAISTSAATPQGVYSVKYQLCDLNTPVNCASVTDTVTVSASPVLTVTKTVSQTPLAIGSPGQFYTIRIAVSNGPTIAAITIADTLPAGITTNGPITIVGGSLSGCPGAGALNLNGCSIAPNVPNGNIDITVPVAVGAAAMGTTAVNSATVSGGGDPTCPAAAHCTGTVSTPVLSPDMQVVPNTVLPNPVVGVPYPAGQTITCTNGSTIPAANAFCTVTDLPPGLISTCNPVSPVTSLAPAGTIVCTISGTPTTSAPINANVVTGADGDTVPTNNNGVITSKPATGLLVTKTASANPLKIGGTNQFYTISIAITNGPTPEPIVLSDNFGAGITSSGPVSITGGTFRAGTCGAASGSGATTLSGCTIEAGVVGTLYITVPINISEEAEGPTGGNNTVIASGGGDPTCPQAANCIGSTGNIAVEYSDLGSLFIRKVADKANAEIGDVVTYQLTVRSTKIRGAAVVNDKLPLGFTLISKTVRVSTGGSYVAAPDPVGAPGPNLAFSINIPAKNQDVVIEYKVRIGLGADRGDGVNSAQALMRNYNLQSMIAKAKVKVTGGVFTREACIVGKVYADCNGNGVQDEKDTGIAGVKLFMENGTTITTDENGQFSLCGVRAVTHVLKIDSTSLPAGSKLGITSNRNMGDPNTLFVDVLAGQIHQAEFRVEGCSAPTGSQKGPATPQSTVVQQGGGVQFDSSQPSSMGLTPTRPIAPAKDGEK
ncbi:MAG TPA: SdrD B-like domain-containing protein [Burkholderiaceae bacterium]|nr:SdrD B-like domain-containing protein [Burkholderiaceae bacterium]